MAIVPLALLAFFARREKDFASADFQMIKTSHLHTQLDSPGGGGM